ncbi:hypothetical protein NQ318_001283 [Aromia moschata]|uniref:Uncharacterized protein n=1 Tax=Aromia moschata TaxID=1265417 RepID=A0AAV8ZG19_9CUCU|nr:hypothetical protein NQ318_001283 [Aromia moschata]
MDHKNYCTTNLLHRYILRTYVSSNKLPLTSDFLYEKDIFGIFYNFKIEKLHKKSLFSKKVEKTSIHVHKKHCLNLKVQLSKHMEQKETYYTLV